jgi:uncharacterized cupredoxin-like copper-binding protein
MNVRKLLVLTALIITATGVATASQPQLTLFPEESSARIDSFTSYELTVENVGPAEDTYTLTSSSVEEIDIAPRKVTLEPGQSETLNVWYNPASQKQEGTYSYTLTATSRATGKRYSTDLTASVIREHDVSIDMVTSKTVCRGEKAQYEVAVTNNGIQREEFSLETDYGQFSQKSVTLEEEETKTVTLTAASNTVTSENFNVRAASKTSYAQAIENVNLNVDPCYRSEMSVTPTQLETPGGAETQLDVTIRNTGTKTDQFTLSANNGRFSDNQIEVEAQSTKTETLSITPEQLGTQTINIKAEGRSTSTATAQLQVYNGNNMEVSFDQKSVKACETTEQAEVNTVIENTGETDETFTLQTTRGNLETKEVQIDAGDTETVTTTVDATRLNTGTYDVQTTVTAASYGQPSKTSTATVTVENCWDVSMNVVPQVASAGENKSTLYEINIENTGTKQNTYELDYEGPHWISIKPDELTVGPRQTGKAYMYAGIPYKKEGNVQITATAVGTEASDSQTVELVVGQKIEQSIRNKEDQTGSLTGNFANPLTDIKAKGTLTQLAAAILLGLILTAAILAREW